MYQYSNKDIGLLIERNNMKRSTTIVALVVGFILLLANFLGVALVEGDLNTTIDTLFKIGQMVSVIIALFSGKKELRTTVFGRKIDD